MRTQNTNIGPNIEQRFQYFRSIALSASGKLMLFSAILAGMLAIQTPAGAPATPASNDKKSMAGNWLVNVDLVNPPPGVSPHFLALQTYLEDGTLLEESNTNRIRSLAHGEWEKVGRREFRRSWIIFRFDAARNYIGTNKQTSTVVLSEDGDEFVTTQLNIELHDAAGNLLSSTVCTADCGEVGHRL